MRITELRVENFKGLRSLTLDGLDDVVLIAGPNGTGKSCVFDAIRLLKSTYGGYRAHDEWNQFFGEYNLDLNKPNEVLQIFYDPAKSVCVKALFELSEGEREYLKKNMELLVREVMFHQLRRAPSP